MKIFGSFSKNIGVDLGTANTFIYLKNKGIVVGEPTVIAVNNKTGQILSIGAEAKRMIDRTPQHISVIRPLIHGVISDFEMAEEILKHYLQNLSEGFFHRFGLAVVSIPTNLTEVEKKSAEDAIISAGASRAFLVEEPIAAALGARLPIEEPAANMIINIGGGTSEIAVISIGGAVVSKSLKVAGDKFNEDIIKFIKEEFKLAIGEPTAEYLKISVGSAIPIDEKLETVIRGKDLTTGLPSEITIKNTHIRAAIAKSLKILAENTRLLIENSPPELVGDILERGIYLSGGSSLLRGLDKYLEKEILTKTTMINDPLTCVIRGLGMIVEDFKKYEKILNSQIKSQDIKI